MGACDDGGYYLLGMRLPYTRLFADIAWSTSSVAATTRIRAAELGLDLVELPPWYHIDDAAALERLVCARAMVMMHCGPVAPYERLGSKRSVRRPVEHDGESTSMLAGMARSGIADVDSVRTAARQS